VPDPARDRRGDGLNGGPAERRQGDAYRPSKTGLLGFFVGQVMQQSGSNANPALVSQLVQEGLGG
jgi:Asp-tRNA(Asn)/Glu-tRNA(Gln) amidotransferase B subunit